MLGVENARNIGKNKVMNGDFNKIIRFLQLRKIILFANVEALDKSYQIIRFQRVSLMIS